MNTPTLPAPAAPGFNPWPYGLVAFLALFVASGAIFVKFALGHPVDLVRADYYDQEIRHQEQIDRVARTAALGPLAGVRHDTRTSTVAVALPPAHLGAGLTGSIHLYRPSDSALDRTVALTPGTDGRQAVDVSDLTPGPWRVRVDWTASGQEYFLEARVIIPAPVS